MASPAQFEQLVALQNAAAEKLIAARAKLDDPAFKGTTAYFTLKGEWEAQERKLAQLQYPVKVAIALYEQQNAVALGAFIPGGFAVDYLGRRAGLWGLGALGIAPVLAIGLVALGAALGAVALYYTMRPTDIPEAQASRTKADNLFEQVMRAAIAGGQLTPEQGAQLTLEFGRTLDDLQQASYRAGRNSRSSWAGTIKWGLIVLGGAFVINRFMPRQSP